jgi:hypothetical protein
MKEIKNINVQAFHFLLTGLLREKVDDCEGMFHNSLDAGIKVILKKITGG